MARGGLLRVDKEGKRKLGKRAISTKLWPTPTFVAVPRGSTIPLAHLLFSHLVVSLVEEHHRRAWEENLFKGNDVEPKKLKR